MRQHGYRISLVIFLFFLLTACSSAGDSKPGDQPVEIEFWHAMSGDLEKALEQITADFNAQSPKAKVKLVYQGSYSDLQQKLMAAAKAKKSPVISQTYADWNTDFIRDGLIADLTPYVRDPKLGWSKRELDDIYPAFLEENKWDGKYYSMPFNKSVPVLFYNKTMLDENGVQVPATWEEWRAASARLTKIKPDGKSKIYGTGFENGVFLELYPYVLQAGGEFYDDKTGKLAFDSPQGREGVSFLSGMLRDGIARMAGEDKFMSEPFGRGDAAMYIGSSAGISFVSKAVGNKFEWSVAVPPKSKKTVAYIQGTNVSVFDMASEEQKRGAWAFIKYLINTENTAYWAQKTGYLPIRSSALQLGSYMQYIKDNPVQGVGIKELEADRFLARIPNARALEPILSKEMEAMLLGSKTVEQGLSDAEKAANAVLEKAASKK